MSTRPILHSIFPTAKDKKKKVVPQEFLLKANYTIQEKAKRRARERRTNSLMNETLPEIQGGRERNTKKFRPDFSVREAKQYTLPAYNGLKDPSLKSYFTNDQLKRQLIDQKLVTKGGYVLTDTKFHERDGAQYNFRRQRRLFKKENGSTNCYMAMQCQY